jgi:hypothetical protein
MYLTAHAVKHRGGGRRVGAVVVQARERALKGGPAAGPAMPLSVDTRGRTRRFRATMTGGTRASLARSRSTLSVQQAGLS